MEDPIESTKTFGFGEVRLGMSALVLTTLVLLVLGLTKNCMMAYIPFILGAVVCVVLAFFLRDRETAKSLFLSVLLILIIGMSLSACDVC